ncbi:MAG: PEP/pyruvate-binding domain-containing protein, partial [Anaerolineae bacterium]
MERFLLPLDQIEAEHQHLVGSKALHLGELRQAGVRVPRGFCITTAAYHLFLQEAGLEAAVSSLDRETVDLQRAPLGQEMVKHPLPDRLYGVIEEAYRGLGEGKPVAVRSSATREDLPEASFAGQY